MRSVPPSRVEHRRVGKHFGQHDARGPRRAPQKPDAPAKNHHMHMNKITQPLAMTSANISSWTNSWPLLLAAADARVCQLLRMQETRLTAAKARSARSAARAVGWAFHLSAATHTGQRGPAPGGVAIAIRRPRGSAQMEPGPATEAAAEGRFAACAVEGGPANCNLALACM